MRFSRLFFLIFTSTFLQVSAAESWNLPCQKIGSGSKCALAVHLPNAEGLYLLNLGNIDFSDEVTIDGKIIGKTLSERDHNSPWLLVRSTQRTYIYPITATDSNKSVNLQIVLDGFPKDGLMPVDIRPYSLRGRLAVEIFPALFTLLFGCILFLMRGEYIKTRFIDRTLLPFCLILTIHLTLNSFYLYQEFYQYSLLILRLHLVTTSYSLFFAFRVIAEVLQIKRFSLLHKISTRLILILPILSFLIPGYGLFLSSASKAILILPLIATAGMIIGGELFYRLIRDPAHSKTFRAPFMLALALLAITGTNDSYNMASQTPIDVPLSGFVLLIIFIFGSFLRLLQEKEIQLTEMQTLRVWKDVSKQVGHDIRSPLTALQVVLSQSHATAEPVRVLLAGAIDRISKIANDLLDTRKGSGQSHGPWLISALLESLTAEKRVEFSKEKNISLVFGISKQNFSLFTSVDSSNFRRVISNLVNNARESIGGPSVNIHIDLRPLPSSRMFRVSVKDNGKGIPREQIENVAARGVSFGKTGGHGLGLASAKEFANSYGGDILIESVVGEGTTVHLDLPLTASPSWFVDVIELSKSSDVIILDDDASIHQIWKGRLESQVDLSAAGLSVFNLYSILEAKKYLSDASIENSTLLFDYELRGEDLTGFDLLVRARARNRILVTSRSFEEEIQRACERENIKLLPKNLAPFVSIKIT